MKKEKILVSALCVLLIVLGLVFAIHYFNVYIGNTRYSIYLIFAIFAFVESLFTGLSFCFYLKGMKNRFVLITYIVSFILAIAVLFCAIVWILYFAGIQLLPPAQQ